ncbi:hypothetical protein JCM18899A_48530 [Nocardioides sp. AN3]
METGETFADQLADRLYEAAGHENENDPNYAERVRICALTDSPGASHRPHQSVAAAT